MIRTCLFVLTMSCLISTVVAQQTVVDDAGAAGSRVSKGCTKVESVETAATVAEGGSDPLATCNRAEMADTDEAQRMSTIALAVAASSSDAPGWSVVNGTVRSFSGRNGTRAYEFSVARVHHTSGLNGVLLSVRRGTNPFFDRRIVRESELAEFGQGFDLQTKSLLGSVGGFLNCAIHLDLNCAEDEAYKLLVQEVGKGLADELVKVLKDIVAFLKDFYAKLLKFGSTASKSVIANLKAGADQQSVNNYVNAVRNYGGGSLSIERKVYEALREIVATSEPQAAQAHAQSIVDLQ